MLSWYEAYSFTGATIARNVRMRASWMIGVIRRSRDLESRNKVPAKPAQWTFKGVIGCEGESARMILRIEGQQLPLQAFNLGADSLQLIAEPHVSRIFGAPGMPGHR
jgi:hypothetical protein